MFEDLERFDQILVTGPQRSGTRIASRMIASDTGHFWVPEEEFKSDSLNLLWEMLFYRTKIVVHCPALSRFSHRIALSRPNCAVVFMRRGLRAIVKSQARIKWKWEASEIIRYDLHDRGLTTQAEVKTTFWNEFQKPALGDRGIAVQYSSLELHPMWISQDQRAEFADRQTQ